MCFVGGKGKEEGWDGQVEEGGRRVCEGKWIPKSNISPENKWKIALLLKGTSYPDKVKSVSFLIYLKKKQMCLPYYKAGKVCKRVRKIEFVLFKNSYDVSIINWIQESTSLILGM